MKLRITALALCLLFLMLAAVACADTSGNVGDPTEPQTSSAHDVSESSASGFDFLPSGVDEIVLPIVEIG